MPTGSSSSYSIAENGHQNKRWRIDIKALAAFVALLWAVTAACYLFDLSPLLAPPMHSEADAWLLGLSGILLLYLSFSSIVATWGFIVSIPSCLLAANICFVRFRPRYRWPFATAISGVLMLTLGRLGIVTAVPSMQPMQKAFEAKIKAEAPAKIARASVFTPLKATTLRDLDPSLPPAPLERMNQHQVIGALGKAARAKCIAPAGADMIDACAHLEEDQKWSQETGRASSDQTVR